MRHAEAIRLELDNAAGTQVVNDYDLLQSLLGYTSLGIGSATSTRVRWRILWNWSSKSCYCILIGRSSVNCKSSLVIGCFPADWISDD
ncbi:hypothetical protein [Pseudomonas sp. SED1]|uniref:hypothetical protein n=1 Tax=Pseudomonas sp. SED1 TaxID=3056845 RepID=UPI00296E8A61|nr:hypothetical protein [Pseudomonas sp. SED1]MDY0832561.1 hypothetical protein [Pseudomonas sp. SED1]